MKRAIDAVASSSGEFLLKKAKASHAKLASGAGFDNTLHHIIAEPTTFDLKNEIKPPALTKPIKKSPGLDLVLYKPFIPRPTSTKLFNYLLEALPWHRVQYPTRGRDITTPRFTTVFGCDETGAPLDTYFRRPRALPPVLTALTDLVERQTNAHYNFVLLNYYADGDHSISYHSDDEAFLGPNPIIASLSLGGARDFLMKHKTESARKEKFVLDDGDLLLMRGETQTQWLHSIPKRAKASPRINLTFRKAINTKATNNYYRYNVGDGGIWRWMDGKMVHAGKPDEKASD